MSPISWAMRPLKRYAQFSGRAPRAEFWWFFLFLTLAWVALLFVFGFSLAGLSGVGAEPTSSVLSAMGIGGILFIVLGLAVLVPLIAVQVRRLHDTNRSGWWVGGYYLLYAAYMVVSVGAVFSVGDGSETPSSGAMAAFAAAGVLGLAMFVYMIILLIFFCLRGTEGPNRFGPDPYGPEDLGEVFA